MRKFGISKFGQSDKAKAIRKLDTALSLLIRADATHCITCGRQTEQFDCGHFRRRECMSTRFDYRNVAPQCLKCNRFEGGRPYEFGIWIDNKWGAGTSKELYDISKQTKQWDLKELDVLLGAARSSVMAYKQVYGELVDNKLAPLA